LILKAAGATFREEAPAAAVSAETFTLPAHAKVNLLLRVLGRRTDGYHEIRTVFQTVTLHDLLTFGPAEAGRFSLECDQTGVPTDERNLVWRAAEALRERYGVRAGAQIKLEKRIPAGGGLGGGSSDAAAALVGLSHLWGLETDAAELSKIGAGLGADVPFFLTGGTALGTGTGTDITPLKDVPEHHLVLVTPGVEVSTAEAYGALKAPALTKEGGVANLSVSRTEAGIYDSLCGVMANDFEAVVCGLYPSIGRAREALLGAGASCAMLSGSGASVFGVFETRGDAGRAGRALGREAGWRVFRCATLSRAGHARSLGRCAAVLRPGRGA